jgi:hypothetical protein
MVKKLLRFILHQKLDHLVNRYKFIKGFEDSEEGYLDFYSYKKNGISKFKIDY